MLSHTNQLSLEYDPTSETATFSYHIAIENDGTADDMVQNISGVLEPPPPESANSVYFNASEFDLSENGIHVAPPFGVTKSAPRHLDCIIKAHINKGTMPLRRGWWHLTMKLGTRKEARPFEVDYHFWMMESDVIDLMSAATLSSIDFPMTR